MLDAVLERLAASDAYVVARRRRRPRRRGRATQRSGCGARVDVAATTTSTHIGHARRRRRPSPAQAPEHATATWKGSPVTSANPLGDIDLHLFNEGTHRHLHHCLGAHPDADRHLVRRLGAERRRHRRARRLRRLDRPPARADRRVRHLVGPRPRRARRPVLPVRRHEPRRRADGEVRPRRCGDQRAAVDGVGDRRARPRLAGRRRGWPGARRRVQPDAPISIYEVHLGSWGRHLTPGNGASRRYDEIADPLADHVLAHGFTHVELLPIMEHPFYGSWGYQTTGYFAPTARYGTPQELMTMVDRLHQRGVGVILDWVPSHFPIDRHGLARFDGTHLYEHADPRQGYHPDWTSAIFNYGRREVRSFLHLQRAVVARALPRRRAAGRRRGVDAVPRLLALGRRVDPQRLRRSGEPRGHRLPAAAQRRHRRGVPRRRHVRRGVDVVADGHGTDRQRRARLRVQVGHGLDARHAPVHPARSRAPPVPPRRGHVPQRLRLQRALRDAAVARRGRPRQGLDDRQDAGRRLADASPTCGCCTG